MPTTPTVPSPQLRPPPRQASFAYPLLSNWSVGRAGSPTRAGAKVGDVRAVGPGTRYYAHEIGRDWLAQAEAAGWGNTTTPRCSRRSSAPDELVSVRDPLHRPRRPDRWPLRAHRASDPAGAGHLPARGLARRWGRPRRRTTFTAKRRARAVCDRAKSPHPAISASRRWRTDLPWARRLGSILPVQGFPRESLRR